VSVKGGKRKKERAGEREIGMEGRRRGWGESDIDCERKWGYGGRGGREI
jgi:hypothetical protein